MLREEYGVSKEEWKEFSRLMIQEGKIVTQRIAEITAKIAAANAERERKESQRKEVM